MASAGKGSIQKEAALAVEAVRALPAVTLLLLLLVLVLVVFLPGAGRGKA